MKFTISLALLISTAVDLSSAHSPIRRRQITQSTAPTPVAGAPTPARSTWQEAAGIEGASNECKPYYYEPISSIVSTYPAIWQTANLQGAGILAADIAFFKSINESIPKIAPRGTRTGDFTGVLYNGVEDPDCWWSYTTCTTPKISTIPADIVRCVEPQSYGYTLDDGPNCSHNAYYDYLRTQKQKATLFYIGSNVLDWPLEAQRGLGDGHDICSHTWSHPYMTSMTNEEAFAELYYAKKAIYDVLGITVQCWRPPYGDVDDRIRWIAQKLGMTTMMWSPGGDTSDWKVATIGVAAVQANYETIIQGGRNGTYSKQGVMVLAHELNNETMVLAEQFLPQIKSVFTGGVMPMAVCMNNSQPYGEQDGKYVYPNIEQWKAGTTSITLLQPTAASRILNIIPSSLATLSSASSTGVALAAGMIASGFSTSSTSSLTSTTGVVAAADNTSASSARSDGSKNILTSFLVIFVSVSAALYIV